MVLLATFHFTVIFNPFQTMISVNLINGGLLFYWYSKNIVSACVWLLVILEGARASTGLCVDVGSGLMI